MKYSFPCFPCFFKVSQKRKAVEAVKAIVISVLGAILSFLKKTVGFVAEHTWALLVFAAELVGVWLMQKVRKS